MIPSRGHTPLRTTRMSALLFSLITLLRPGAGRGQDFDPNAMMPKPQQDLSAFRADSDILGWDRAYTSMAVIGSEIWRYPRGKQRGEAFLAVFNIGEMTPTDNVHLAYVTQADNPTNPLPILNASGYKWSVGYEFETMWPRRGKKKPRKGYMRFQTLSTTEVVRGDICAPKIGFLLTLGKDVRYQPHRRLKIEAPCSLLRKADERRYWAKKDLAATFVRYDYNDQPYNEKSTRSPLAVSWALAKPVHFTLRHARGNKKIRLIKKQFKKFGSTSTEIVPLAELGEGVSMLVPPALIEFAKVLQHNVGFPLRIETGNVQADTDEAGFLIVVNLAALETKQGGRMNAAHNMPGEHDMSGEHNVHGDHPKSPETKSYIDDFSP